MLHGIVGPMVHPSIALTAAHMANVPHNAHLLMDIILWQDQGRFSGGLQDVMEAPWHALPRG